MTKQEQIELLATQIAAYCYAQAVLNSQSGNWHILENELEDQFYVTGFSLTDDELRDAILQKLYEYDGMLDVEINYDEDHKEYDIDILIGSAYCPQNDEDESNFSSANYDELEDYEE